MTRTKYTYDEETVVEQLHHQDTAQSAFGKVVEHYTQPLYWQIRRMVIPGINRLMIGKRSILNPCIL